MDFQFQLVAGSPALDFANSLDFRFDPARTIDLVPTYERLIDFTRQSDLLTDTQVRRLRELQDSHKAKRTIERALQFREILESIFRSVLSKKTPSNHCIETLNDFLAGAREHEKVFWKSGRLVRGFDEFGGDPEAPIWLLAESAAELLASPELALLRECHDKSCRWLFLDRSKNHSRRWCAMELCGNRAKIKKFRGKG